MKIKIHKEKTLPILCSGKMFTSCKLPVTSHKTKKDKYYNNKCNFDVIKK